MDEALVAPVAVRDAARPLPRGGGSTRGSCSAAIAPSAMAADPSFFVGLAHHRPPPEPCKLCGLREFSGAIANSGGEPDSSKLFSAIDCFTLQENRRAVSLPALGIYVSAVPVGSYFNRLLPTGAGMARTLRESGAPLRKRMQSGRARGGPVSAVSVPPDGIALRDAEPACPTSAENFRDFTRS
jgi:hypothetical protein